MRKIIIASHHQLASGMVDTLNYIMPNIQNITAIDAYMDNTPVEDAIKESLNDLSATDEALIFTDLLGGSVNQAFVPYLSKGNIHVVTGMNLPVIMTLLLALGGTPIEPAQIQTAIEESQTQLLYVNDFIKEQAMDEEDE
ncbi:MAG: PTS N-acetylglucosamine transporter subunit IIBC [Aerococcus sp.]|nr:PTS N-acetylglucosamine transporter subunit IIBC [Aerococcus sp.]